MHSAAAVCHPRGPTGPIDLVGAEKSCLRWYVQDGVPRPPRNCPLQLQAFVSSPSQITRRIDPWRSRTFERNAAGQAARDEFEKRYRSRFIDPVFQPLQRELDAIVAAAWDAYSHSRKAPVTRKAGPGFADPDYELSVDWLAARDAILAAQRRHDDAVAPPRILIINGSSRSEHTCPGEMSKSWRLVKLAEPVLSKWDLPSICSTCRG